MKKDRKLKQSVLLLCLCASLTACTKSDEEKIIGKWQCTQNTQGMTTVSTDVFKEDGTNESEAVVTGSSPMGEISVSVTSTMNWSIKDNKIISSNNNLTIVNAEPAEIKPLFEQGFEAMKNQTIEYDLKIDNDTMTIKAPGMETTCSRI